MIKDLLGRINTDSLLKRTAFLAIPVLLMPFGIACYYACGLGADPFSIFVDGEHVWLGWTYGQITLLNNLILFTLMLIFGRKYIGVGTVVTVFTTGALIDFFRALIAETFPVPGSALWIRLLILAVGCVTFAVGVGFYISIEFGIGAAEFISLFIVGKTGVSLKYVRIALDALYVVIGYLMGGTVGVGTIVGIVATGPIVEWTLNRVKAPIARVCGPLKRTE
ncbi:MAG: YitT family protein [Oscillospiraceae bacterium]|nr:YitT family protein [Oscillospiraceae bacterium]